MKEEPNFLSEKETQVILQYKKKGLAQAVVHFFQQLIYDFYRIHGRDLPWRKTDNSYHILISEIMLQQTQVEKVMEKYNQFIRIFPDFLSLSKASLQDILEVWQGLGYNRRALALKNSAQIVVSKYGGNLPSDIEQLTTLPGIGNTTASEIAAFAYNQPAIFIETNIRSIFIHFFFQDQNNIKDKDILPFIEKTLDRTNPREWYYALMDYGVMLKKRDKRITKKSAHYVRQKPFEGSNRQIRGIIIRALINDGNMTENKIVAKINVNPSQIKENLAQLEKEGLIKKREGAYTIT
jgi:A/G-specific adenine glycosylase